MQPVSVMCNLIFVQLAKFMNETLCMSFLDGVSFSIPPEQWSLSRQSGVGKAQNPVELQHVMKLCFVMATRLFRRARYL